MMKRLSITLAAAVTLVVPNAAAPQRPGGPGGGFGPPGGGPPGMGGERKIVAQFDKNGDKRLDAAERKEARTFLESQPMGRGPGGRGGPGRGGMVGLPGAKLTPADVKPVAATVPLYDMGTVRTLFLDFETSDWEAELMAFNNTDVEVPATLTVDGKTYRDVGIHFRGASSYFGVPAGLKHSLNVAVDFVHESQALLGHRTLNLLNSNDDPTYLRTVLFLAAAREHIAAPRANYVRVSINGESWGVYVSAEQFNKDFVNAWYKTPDGARWKVPGSPGGRGGLEYLGDDITAYKRVYEIKSKDDAKSWQSLINLTKVLNETAPDQLEQALAPILDVDGALKFLALEATLVNNDGYWTRASDYSLYQSPAGKFHVLPARRERDVRAGRWARHDDGSATPTTTRWRGSRAATARPAWPWRSRWTGRRRRSWFRPRRWPRTGSAHRTRRPHEAAPFEAPRRAGASLPLHGLREADRREVARLEHGRPARAEVPDAHRRRRESGYAQARQLRSVRARTDAAQELHGAAEDVLGELQVMSATGRNAGSAAMGSAPNWPTFIAPLPHCRGCLICFYDSPNPCRYSRVRNWFAVELFVIRMVASS